MDAVLLGKHMGWRRSKANNHVGIDLQSFEETDFIHMWSCNVSSRKFSLQAPSVHFLTPRRPFGTQTSYHSNSSQHSELFPGGKFSRGGWALPWQSIHVFLDCTAAKKTQWTHRNSQEQNPNPLPASSAHALHRQSWTCTHRGWIHRAKVYFCATVQGGVWSSSLFKTSQVRFICGLRYNMGQTKGQMKLLNSGTWITLWVGRINHKTKSTRGYFFPHNLHLTLPPPTIQF